ncbi:hypothetical protein ACTZWW_17580 [Salinarimonas sp. NSM]|uniref:hypothetical protein n=1 Tax=Salinarimonas TaxID=690086 RepID=UPI000402A6B0|nr:hypothetical protein [Salinarimonas rosea]
MSDVDNERPWTYEQVQELIALARENVPASVISMKTKRSQASVHAKLSELGLSVPPEA